MIINLGSNREFFFDSFIVDCENTTAEFALHKPVAKEIVMELEENSFYR